MKILFYLIFAMEMGTAFTITDKIADKIKNKYEHQQIYNIIGLIVAILFFIISAKISYDGWIRLSVVTIVIGFILLCISFQSLTFVQKDYTSHKK